MRQGDLNRLFKAAIKLGLVVERRPDGTMRFIPPALAGLTSQPDAPSPSDPLDAELAEWAAKHGYA